MQGQVLTSTLSWYIRLLRIRTAIFRSINLIRFWPLVSCCFSEPYSEPGRQTCVLVRCRTCLWSPPTRASISTSTASITPCMTCLCCSAHCCNCSSFCCWRFPKYANKLVRFSMAEVLASRQLSTAAQQAQGPANSVHCVRVR